MDCKIFLQTSTSFVRDCPISGVSETRIVSPIPCWRSIDKAALLETIPFIFPPASVSQRWSGYSHREAIFSYADIIDWRCDILTEMMMLSFGSPLSTALLAERSHDSTMVFIYTSSEESGWFREAFSSIFFESNSLSSEPPFTQIRTGLSYLIAQSIILKNWSSFLSHFPTFPGLIRYFAMSFAICGYFSRSMCPL